MRLATGSRRIDCVVVPIVGINAFACSDFAGGGTIGVTEGALARLTRQQLQAIVAHEIADIASGDAVTATVACSLFGVYSSVCEKLDDAAEAGAGASAGANFMSLFLLPRVALGLIQLGSAVVAAALSRQREFRADAAAVRYTRDPLSLAQALPAIARHSGGAGFIPSGLSPLCIITAGGWATWLDRLAMGHPPMEQRIGVLLESANVSWPQFAQEALHAEHAMEQREHSAPLPAGTAGGVVAASLASDVGGRPLCPTCQRPLTSIPFEGIEILVCGACGGRLVTPEQVQRILARREVEFTDEQRRLADVTRREGDHLRRQAVLSRGQRQALTSCPVCGRAMLRRQYSLQDAVEVDICLVCDVIWFDKDELEVLQLLVEGDVERDELWSSGASWSRAGPHLGEPPFAAAQGTVVRLAHVGARAVQHLAEVVDARGDDGKTVLSVVLQLALNQEVDRLLEQLAVCEEDVVEDDDFGHAGLVFEGEEEGSVAGANPGHLGPLKHSGDANARAVGRLGQVAKGDAAEAPYVGTREGQRVLAHVETENFDLSADAIGRRP